MSRLSAINLAALPLPAATEPLSFDLILAEMKARVIEIAPELAPVLALESDPVAKIFEVFAYRELLVRAATNDKVRAVHLATAMGSDLEHLVALFGVQRLTVTPADPTATPPKAAVMETDNALRLRGQLALDGFTTAGSRASYEYHARSVSAEIADVAVDSPAPGTVRVTLLTATGTGVAAPTLVAAVQSALDADEVRPLCDTVVVQSAVIVPFVITADLTLQDGPDPAVVLAEARAELQRYLTDVRGVGRTIRLSAIFAALHRPGVDAVNLTAPVGDVVIGPTSAAHCTAATITLDGGAT